MINRSLELSPINEQKKQSNTPLLKNLFGDSDTVLILMLILLLYSDNCDRILLFALIYIIA